eukprot:g283.t1
MGAGASIAEGATPRTDDASAANDEKGNDLTEEDLRRAIMAELIQPDDASDINSIEDAKALLVAYRRAARSAAENQNLRGSNEEEQGDGKSGNSTLKKELPRSLTMETDRVTIAPQQASSVESAEMRQLEHDRVQKIFEPIVALKRRSSIEAVQEVVSRMSGDDGHTETLSWFACELLADFCAGDYETQYVEAGCLAALSTCLDESIRSMAAASSSAATGGDSAAALVEETNGASARFQVYCRAALNASKASAETLQTRAGDVERVRTLLEKGAEVCSEPMAQWRAKSSSEALQKALGASSSSTAPKGA